MHEWASPMFQRIHEQVRTDGARACVELADDIYRQAAHLDNPAHGWTEARHYVAQALAIDKAEADREIKAMGERFLRKAARRNAADQLAASIESGRTAPPRH